MLSITNILESTTKENWRVRSEVYIIKDNNLIVGVPPKWKGYIIPGGGVDKGEDLKSAAKREALEEIATKCKNLEFISKTKIKHYQPRNLTHNKNKILGRINDFTGSIFNTFVAEFDGYDKKLQTKDLDDLYKPKEITFDEAISFFKQHKKNCEKNDDRFNVNKCKYTLEILNIIKNKKNIE